MHQQTYVINVNAAVKYLAFIGKPLDGKVPMIDHVMLRKAMVLRKQSELKKPCTKSMWAKLVASIKTKMSKMREMLSNITFGSPSQGEVNSLVKTYFSKKEKELSKNSLLRPMVTELEKDQAIYSS